MVKAIVRINAFLDKKQMEDTYNFIYGQLKSGLEVITVPYYCEVYILDGGDIEIQKDIPIFKKKCITCKYYIGDGVIKEPCIGCTDHDCWEAKDNVNGV